MTRRGTWTAGAVALAVTLAGGCASMGGAKTPPNEALAGSWVRDADASAPGQPGDSAGWRGREGRRGGRFPGRGGYPGGAGYPGGGGGRGMRGGRPPVDFAAMRAAFQSILGRQGRLILEVRSDSAVIQPSNGPVIRLPLDAQWHETTLPGDVQVKTRAAWRDHGLVIEHEHEGGLKVREEFTRNPGAKRLVDTLTISGVGPGSRTMVEVFDLAAPDEAHGGSGGGRR